MQTFLYGDALSITDTEQNTQTYLHAYNSELFCINSTQKVIDYRADKESMRCINTGTIDLLTITGRFKCSLIAKLFKWQ